MFIYLFEDGTYGVSAVAPLIDDRPMIADGTLIVLYASKDKEGNISVTEISEDLTEMKPDTAGIQDDETGNYHYSQRS